MVNGNNGQQQQQSENISIIYVICGSYAHIYTNTHTYMTVQVYLQHKKSHFFRPLSLSVCIIKILFP